MPSLGARRCEKYSSHELRPPWSLAAGFSSSGSSSVASRVDASSFWLSISLAAGCALLWLSSGVLVVSPGSVRAPPLPWGSVRAPHQPVGVVVAVRWFPFSRALPMCVHTSPSVLAICLRKPSMWEAHWHLSLAGRSPGLARDMQTGQTIRFPYCSGLLLIAVAGSLLGSCLWCIYCGSFWSVSRGSLGPSFSSSRCTLSQSLAGLSRVGLLGWFVLARARYQFGIQCSSLWVRSAILGCACSAASGPGSIALAAAVLSSPAARASVVL